MFLTAIGSHKHPELAEAESPEPQDTSATGEEHESVIAVHPQPRSESPQQPRGAAAERAPLADAHTVTSRLKRRPPVNFITQSSLRHLQPLASLVRSPPSQETTLHVSVTGAVMAAADLAAIAEGTAPSLFAAEATVAPNAVWVPPSVVPRIGGLACHVPAGARLCHACYHLSSPSLCAKPWECEIGSRCTPSMWRGIHNS